MSDPTNGHSLQWDEVAAAVFAAKGITKGLWRVAVKLQFSGTTGDWNTKGGTTKPLPTAIVGVESIELMRADKPGAMVFDASLDRIALGRGRAAGKAVAKAVPVTARSRARSD